MRTVEKPIIDLLTLQVTKSAAVRLGHGLEVMAVCTWHRLVCVLMFMYLYRNLHKTLQDDLFGGIRGHQELEKSWTSKALKTSQGQSHVSKLLVHFCLSIQMICAGCLLAEREVVVMTAEMVEVEVVGGMADVAIWQMGINGGGEV